MVACSWHSSCYCRMATPGEKMTEMQIIQKTLSIIETKQTERHNENMVKFKNLFDKVDSAHQIMANLNCAVHVERMRNLAIGLNCLWFMVITVIVGGIVLGIWVKAATAIN